MKSKWMVIAVICLMMELSCLTAISKLPSVQMPNSFVNSIGMKFVRIEPGSFLMGQKEGGDWDERPVYRVTISRPFWMAVTEVTNAQYEQFDREHRKLRGKLGFSKQDDEAVVFVSWHEAAKFCEWLSNKEAKPYRLPTEAEWEYACRAGTITAYYTGKTLPKAYHKHQRFEWDPKPVSLEVGKAPANNWGLKDMHGNVEEWCHDWYGPYEKADQIDPIGRVAGLFKVTRGGSHNTALWYLRSANRLGTLPDDKHWLIGFRIVLGELSTTEPLSKPKVPLWAQDVPQTIYDWADAPDMNQPYFKGPQQFVHIPPDSNGPLFSRHNHCPSITWCPNGDLLAVWYSTNKENGREMTIVASRLRQGSVSWNPASVFFKAPDRNMTGSSLYHYGKGMIFFFNGLEAAGGWSNLALVMRTSTDNGATWSEPRLINPYHQPRNQVIDGTLCTQEGFLIQPCDAVHGGSGGTAIHISRDGGRTWVDPGAGRPSPSFASGTTGAWIAGIHAGVVQLKDGSLMAFGRGNNIDGRMPMSLSKDMGQTWTYTASEFPPISGGQRLVLRRLREGPILLVSFTDSSKKEPKGILLRDSSEKEHRVYGMFAALSFDEGKTWPCKRLVTAGGAARELDGGGNTRSFIMDDNHAEPRGYLAATQTPDGLIHLISSKQYYVFNLAWLKQCTPVAGTERSRAGSPLICRKSQK